MLRGWRNLTPALALMALAIWLPVIGFIWSRPATSLESTGVAARVRGPGPGAYPWLRSGQVVWYADAHQKLIALTFDDGPHPIYTSQVLAVLARHGGHATFFLMGQQVERYPDLARQIVAQGNEAGNHGYGHLHLQGRGSAAIAAELKRAGNAIAAATGQQPTLFRPPGGGVFRDVVDTASALGYRTVLWSWTQDTRDWARPGVKRLVQQVTDGVAPGDIVLMHEGPGNGQTVQAVDAIMTELERRGYRFVTVSELLKAG